MTASNHDDRPNGLCGCGCGGRTTIAAITRNGNVRGEPNAFIQGHRKPQPRPRPAPAGAPACDENSIETCSACENPMHRPVDGAPKRVCAAGHPVAGRGGKCRRCTDRNSAAEPGPRGRGGRRPGSDPLVARRAVSEWTHLGIVMGMRVAEVAKALDTSDEWLRRVVLSNTDPDSDAHREMVRSWEREHPNNNSQSRKPA